MNPSHVRTRFAVASCTTALLIAAGASVAAAMRTSASDPPSPATGHAEVIAQSLVEFGDGAYAWTATPHAVDAAGTSLTADSPTFLLAGDGSAVHISGTDGDSSRLAGGEAAFRRAGSATQANSLGATTASLTALTIGPGDAAGTFIPGAGAHDVDLLRDVLAPGETFTLTAQIPAVVLVTDGAVNDGQGRVLDAGATAMLYGDVALTNTADAPAVVVVAVIGPTVDTAAATSPPATDTTGSTAPPPASIPQDESTVPNLVHPLDPARPADHHLSRGDIDPARHPDHPNHRPGPRTDPAQITTPTTESLFGDTDGDGLRLALEIAHGTDPSNPDTDGDGYNDGAEIDVGTDPTDPNSHLR